MHYTVFIRVILVIILYIYVIIDDSGKTIVWFVWYDLLYDNFNITLMTGVVTYMVSTVLVLVI